MPCNSLTIHPLPLDAEIIAGDSLIDLLLDSCQRYLPFEAADILVVAQKVVSKSEGRYVDLCTVVPGSRARELAAITHKDPRLVEVILSESSAVVRAVPNVLIVRHRCGLVMANAGIDRSNVVLENGREPVLLLPVDADQSAARIRNDLLRLCGVGVGVIICDSFGRPWRQGVTNVAIGAAGLASIEDHRGARDRQGRVLEVTQVAVGDALAAVAGLVMGEAAEGVPAALVRGWRSAQPDRPAQAIIRPLEEDLFR